MHLDLRQWCSALALWGVWICQENKTHKAPYLELFFDEQQWLPPESDVCGLFRKQAQRETCRDWESERGRERMALTFLIITNKQSAMYSLQPNKRTPSLDKLLFAHCKTEHPPSFSSSYTSFPTCIFTSIGTGMYINAFSALAEAS